MTTSLSPHLRNVGPPPGLFPIPLHKAQRSDSVSEESNGGRSSVSSWTSSSRTIATPVHDDFDTFQKTPFTYTKPGQELLSFADVHSIQKNAHQPRRQSISSSLDVRAPPFVPKGRRPSLLPQFIEAYDPNMVPDLTPPPPIPESPEVKYDGPPPMWYSYLLTGATSTDMDIRERYALSLIQSVETIWDSENIRELTLHLCQQAMEPECDRYLLVLFAWKIYKIFDRIPGSDVTYLFLHHLENAVLSHFMCRWDPETPYGIPSDPTEISPAYILSSLSLSEFVGRLFVHGLLSRAATKEALATLFKGGLGSLPRFEAAELIIYNLTRQFWDGYKTQLYSVIAYLYAEMGDLHIDDVQYKMELETRIQKLASDMLSTYTNINPDSILPYSVGTS